METEKKQRRKKKELDEAIWTALEKLIIERGFNEITLAGLAQEAGVEPPVIYNRFEGIDELLEKYVRRYDYWLNDIISLEKELTPKENFKKLLVDLINELYANEIMQRILVWEMNDTHRITRRMALTREVDSSDLLQYFNSGLETFDPINALMISGIYYLILHRKISTFSNINFNTPQGKEIMSETVGRIIDKLYPETISPDEHKLKMDIAKKFKEKGVDKGIIKEATGLSIEEIDRL